jgi:hypothetical protein
MEEHYDEMERILNRFNKEDLKNIHELLKVFEKILKSKNSVNGYKDYTVKKQLEEYLDTLRADGHSEEYLEVSRFNQMRRLGMITQEDLLVKLKENADRRTSLNEI